MIRQVLTQAIQEIMQVGKWVVLQTYNPTQAVVHYSADCVVAAVMWYYSAPLSRHCHRPGLWLPLALAEMDPLADGPLPLVRCVPYLSCHAANVLWCYAMSCYGMLWCYTVEMRALPFLPMCYCVPLRLRVTTLTTIFVSLHRIVIVMLTSQTDKYEFNSNLNLWNS